MTICIVNDLISLVGRLAAAARVHAGAVPAKVTAEVVMETKKDDSKPKEPEKEMVKEVKPVEEPKAPRDKTRPVSSTPVPGTPWYEFACTKRRIKPYLSHSSLNFVRGRCVVWTGDGRVFFYNPSTRSSVWEKPEELKNRVDVDKMMSNSPDSQPCMSFIFILNKEIIGVISIMKMVFSKFS